VLGFKRRHWGTGFPYLLGGRATIATAYFGAV
jgi:hypothetical protein